MFRRDSKTDVDIPANQLVSPSITGLMRPNASGSSVRAGVPDRLIVDASVEGKVWVRVKNDPIRIGEETGPVLDTGESVSDGDVESLTDAGDLSERVVSLNVTA